MTEKGEKDKAGRRRSIGKFIDRIFRGRSQSIPESAAEEVKKETKGKKKKKQKFDRSASEASSEVDEVFGIGETERLTHFQKPKPPLNRRWPRGVPQTSSTSPPKVEPIPEEEDESGCQSPESPASKNNESENAVVKDKMIEVPRLFTPALPPTSSKPKLFFKKDRSEVVDNGSAARTVDESDRKSESIEVISESETELRKMSSDSFEVAVADVNSDTVSSKKSSLSLSLSKSISGKIDFEQIRAKSKNLRLVKSLEVGQGLIL